MAQRKITFLTSLAAGLEYYDFLIYAMMAKTLSQLFFPTSHAHTALLSTFAVLAIGYLARPLGGMIFGSLGDRVGRKKTFLLTVAVMATASLTMALMPTYAQMGILASYILVGLRLLQGLALGAELPGAITFLVEHVKGNRRGLHCGLMVASIGIGSSFASLTLFLLHHFLTPEALLAWGWRIPFCVGGVIAIVGYFMRRKLQETPLFAEQEKSKAPLTELLKTQRPSILLGIGMLSFPACIIIFHLYMPTYLHDFFHYPLAQIYSAISVGYIWSALLIPFVGHFSDRIGRHKFMCIAVLITMVFCYPTFALFTLGTKTALFFAVFLLQTCTGLLAGNYFVMLPELFPTRVRYSGVAVCYNTVYCVAGCIPYVLSLLLGYWPQPMIVPVLFLGIGVVSLFAVFALRPLVRVQLTET